MIMQVINMVIAGLMTTEENLPTNIRIVLQEMKEVTIGIMIGGQTLDRTTKRRGIITGKQMIQIGLTETTTEGDTQMRIKGNRDLMPRNRTGTRQTGGKTEDNRGLKETEEETVKKGDIMREDIMTKDIMREDIMREDTMKKDIMKEDTMKEEGGRIRLQGEITQTNQIVQETDRKLGIKTGGQETSRTTNKTDPGQKCLGAMQARNRRMVIGILHRNSLQPRRTLTPETSLTATSFSNLHSQCPSLTLMYRLPHFFSNTTTSCQIKG